MVRRLAAILAADVAGYSRLMSEDEAGTLAALQAHRSEVVAPAIEKRGGRIVKLMGDGVLAEFDSAVEAVECAAEIQRAMAGRQKANGEMQFRIGVHLGDVVIDGDDIYGDGVNIAARLQSIAEVGGVSISRQVHDLVDGKATVGFRALGAQALKNITKPVEVYAMELDGGEKRVAANIKQKIGYCRARDGVRIAYATAGEGPPLVKTANWMNHLEYDWESPIIRPILMGLASEHTLTRYDARGNGLSDWDVDELSLDAWVGDLETVVDAIGIERFPLLGMSQGCAIAIAYAVRHPDRVSHLILCGGFAAGRMKRAASDLDREKFRAMETLIRTGWGEESSAFRQVFTSLFAPSATKEQADAFNELQRRTTSPECAVRYYRTTGDIDVTALLPQVRTPTLVLHVRDDLVAPLEVGRQMAAGIAGARFVAVPGKNHIPLEGDPALERFLEEIKLFLGQ
jgi:class 3 adenylate cyclase/pimeloyl-ACP methyl ester carboxylesterase